jgi:hypothetical protein
MIRRNTIIITLDITFLIVYFSGVEYTHNLWVGVGGLVIILFVLWLSSMFWIRDCWSHLDYMPSFGSLTATDEGKK